MTKKILYFDKVFEEFKKILHEQKPEGFDLWFWDEMADEEKDEKLSEADYLLVATKKIGENIFKKAAKAKFMSGNQSQ
ncbi:hypothetical protein L1765_08935 [Microaerobacter geothermalis]|nr:hypothetical protein [Microaerobacter geothermalis]